jgi:putative flippase GtrA
MQPAVLALPRAPRLPLAVRYTVFAGISTAINLAVQASVMALYGGPFALAVAMLFGTGSGILPKYFLDKRWIFNDRSTGLDNHARKLTLYTTLSGGTTLIFWATEFLFDRIGHGGSLHYLGAVLGLAIGYWTKYHLDRRLVFDRTL